MVRFHMKTFDLKLSLVFLERSQAEDFPEKITQPDREMNTFIRKHRTSIRTFSKKRKVQSIFNFCYNEDLKLLIPKTINRILQLKKKRFKLNYSFAYILKNINNGQLRYYHASYNNNVMMECLFD